MRQRCASCYQMFSRNDSSQTRCCECSRRRAGTNASDHCFLTKLEADHHDGALLHDLMSTRAANTLRRYGIETAGELKGLSDNAPLLRIKNAGKQTVAEIYHVRDLLRAAPMVAHAQTPKVVTAPEANDLAELQYEVRRLKAAVVGLRLEHEKTVEYAKDLERKLGRLAEKVYDELGVRRTA